MTTLAAALQALGAESVGLALDQDPPGWAASRRLVEALSPHYGLGLVTWDAAYKGLDDALAAGAETTILTGEDLVTFLEAKTTPVKLPPAGTISRSPTVQLLSGVEVWRTPWPSPPFVVPELLPVGLSLLAGKSKIGKSFMTLDLCISVATGTPFLDEGWTLPTGKVLYLAFEDTPRNLSRRMGMLMRGREELTRPLQENLRVAPSNAGVPRMPGGAVWLKEAILKGGDYRLVVIDTLERFRPVDLDGRKHSYQGDYGLMEELKGWAEEHNLAVLLVHHVRKNARDADDVFDTILGSTGILGAPDTLLLLTRDRGSDSGKLIAAGREVQHTEIPLSFDQHLGRWQKSSSPGGKEGGLTAEVFLKDLLGGGSPVMVKDVFAAGKSAGFSEDQLQRAKSRLGNVEVKKAGKGWAWRLLQPPSELETRIQELDAAFDKAVGEERYEEAASLKAERDRLQEELDKRKKGD